MSAAPGAPGGPDDAAELEALLQKGPPPVPAPAFRERARQEFLGRGGASRAPEDERTRGEVQPDHDLFERWLARALAPPRARAEYRERLQRRFLSGAWAQGLAPEDHAAPGPTLAPRSRRLRAGAVLLAAAAIAAVTLLLPSVPRWEVRIQGNGPVRFAGREFAPGDERLLAVELERAGSLETGEAEVTLRLGGGSLVVRARPGSTVALPDVPDLAHGDPLALTLETGELHVRTGSAYPGNPLAVLTPEAEVRMQGTVFGVLACVQGTCVCVARGEVGVVGRRPGVGPSSVAASSTLFLFADPLQAPRATPFPASSDSTEHAHTRDLERFAAE